MFSQYCVFVGSGTSWELSPLSPLQLDSKATAPNQTVDGYNTEKHMKKYEEAYECDTLELLTE